MKKASLIMGCKLCGSIFDNNIDLDQYYGDKELALSANYDLTMLHQCNTSSRGIAKTIGIIEDE